MLENCVILNINFQDKLKKSLALAYVLRVHSRFEFQVGHSILSTNLTTDQKTFKKHYLEQKYFVIFYGSLNNFVKFISFNVDLDA